MGFLGRDQPPTDNEEVESYLEKRAGDSPVMAADVDKPIEGILAFNDESQSYDLLYGCDTTLLADWKLDLAVLQKLGAKFNKSETPTKMTILAKKVTDSADRMGRLYCSRLSSFAERSDQVSFLDAYRMKSAIYQFDFQASGDEDYNTFLHKMAYRHERIVTMINPSIEDSQRRDELSFILSSYVGLTCIYRALYALENTNFKKVCVPKELFPVLEASFL